MPYITVKSGHFLAQRKELENTDSKLLLTAVDFIDASLWLIGGNRLAQAVVMLDNAIEVTLKADLERIHKILITDHRELNDFGRLKSLLRDEFLKHPSGSAIAIEEFDIEKTIGFETAFDRVADLYPELGDSWRKELISSKGGRGNSLHSLRNDIVHYGGKSKLEGRYAEVMVNTAFPFLKELFGLITTGKVSFPHLLKEWIYREIEVAQSVLHELQSEKEPPKPYAIKTLQHHVLWTNATWPSPRDDLSVFETSGWSDWDKYIERQKSVLFQKWDEDLTVEISCPVCNSDTTDGSYVQAQVLLEEAPLDNNKLVAEGFNCFVCGLHISPKERFLAKHFVGQIPEDTATEYLKSFGRI